mgnify:CR=1 FL=1
MRIRRTLAWLSLLLLAATAGCGKEASGPTGPSPGRSFLEGTWSGTLTIERPGEELRCEQRESAAEDDAGDLAFCAALSEHEHQSTDHDRDKCKRPR